MPCPRFALVALTLTLAFAVGHRANAETDLGVSDRDIEPFQIKLLDLAYESASTFPINPHIKNRSRAQLAVVDAALHLGQPSLAARYAEGIANWRRGQAYARLALYHLEHGGNDEDAKQFMQEAERVAKVPGLASWRYDRIMGPVGRCYQLLEQAEEADRVAATVDDTTQAQLIVQKDGGGDQDFENDLAVVRGLIKNEDYDRSSVAVNLLIDMYADHFCESEKRKKIVELIRRAYRDFPPVHRLNTLYKLAQVSIEQRDIAEASDFIDEAETYQDRFRWPLQQYVPMLVRLAELRHQAGDPARASETLERAVTTFHEHKSELYTYQHAAVIRDIAAGFAKTGKLERAHSLYGEAVDAGSINPNVRPRTEDIVHTAVSMALSGVEPDADLFSAMQGILKDLSER